MRRVEVKKIHYISVYEHVVIFLLKIRHNCRNFLTTVPTFLGGEPISHYPQALVAFAKEMVKAMSFDDTSLSY